MRPAPTAFQLGDRLHELALRLDKRRSRSAATRSEKRITTRRQRDAHHLRRVARTAAAAPPAVSSRSGSTCRAWSRTDAPVGLPASRGPNRSCVGVHAFTLLSASRIERRNTSLQRGTRPDHDMKYDVDSAQESAYPFAVNLSRRSRRAGESSELRRAVDDSGERSFEPGARDEARRRYDRRADVEQETAAVGVCMAAVSSHLLPKRRAR